MFRVAIGLLVVAIIAAIFGFGGIASTATGFAKIVFVIALILAVVSFLVGGRGGGVIPALLIGGATLLAASGSARADVYVENNATQTYVRQGIIIGGGIGVGHIACDGADCSGVNEAGGLNLQLGGLLSPNLGLLVDAWGMSHTDGDNATFTHAILVGALRYWLVPRLWVQGGVGVAQATWDYSDANVEFTSQSDTVPALMGAAGLELISTPTFAMNLELRAGSGFFEDDVRVRNLQVGLGVDWY
jgi:uncharacterized membrane protein YtjA (UPF0391 family)